MPGLLRFVGISGLDSDGSEVCNTGLEGGVDECLLALRLRVQGPRLFIRLP